MRITKRTNYKKEKYGLDLKYRISSIYDNAPVEKNPEKVEQQNKIKQVCLNCTKKKCRGTKECFMREKNNKALKERSDNG